MLLSYFDKIWGNDIFNPFHKKVVFEEKIYITSQKWSMI